MRIAVVGAGAIGGYFGGRLVEAGEDVVFLARGKQLKALRATGLHIDSPNGNLVLSSVEATDEPGAVGDQAIRKSVPAEQQYRSCSVAEEVERTGREHGRESRVRRISAPGPGDIIP